jgi:hypothetical protein
MRGAGSQDTRPHRARFVASCALIFLVALGVRFLAWHDARFEAARVQTAVAENYRHSARLFEREGVAAYFSRESAHADPDTLGHPPGYPLYLAFVARFFGDSERAAPFIQFALDAATSALLFLLAVELLPFGAAFIAGLFVALAPQFVWNSLAPLPDTLAAGLVLLAVYCLARAARRPRLLTIVLAGAFVGLSCWLRANALLLAPFLAVAAWLLFERETRTRYALALVAGALVMVAPLTLRNALVFRSFIPVSLGAGQTLLEGIADYDDEGRLGIPRTDLGIMRQEAEAAGRPDYAETLFGPDAIARERSRLQRGRAVIFERPFWFACVMGQRALSMLKLERARRVEPRPPVTHALDGGGGARLVWAQSPSELLMGGAATSPGAEVSLRQGGAALRVAGDHSKHALQFVSAPIAVEAGADYVFSVPVRIERGRMSVGALDAADDTLRVSTIIEPLEGKTAAGQPSSVVRAPFASAAAGSVRLALANAPSGMERPLVEITEEVRLHKLGPASLLWTRYPRALINALQKLFITAIMLPLAIGGLALLARAGHRRALILLSVAPVYYLCVQSALHTEYRYVLAIHYFFFALAAFGVYRAGLALRVGARNLRRAPERG